MKLIEKSSILYASRLAKEINKRQLDFPYFRLTGSRFDGRRIIRASIINGALIGTSLNGEEFPINVNYIFDGNGQQICANREL